MTKVKYPDVKVRLTGTDGNAFSVMGRVGKAIADKHGIAAKNVFYDEAAACESYDALLVLVMKTVEVS